MKESKKEEKWVSRVCGSVAFAPSTKGFNSVCLELILYKCKVSFIQYSRKRNYIFLRFCVFARLNHSRIWVVRAQHLSGLTFPTFSPNITSLFSCVFYPGFLVSVTVINFSPSLILLSFLSLWVLGDKNPISFLSLSHSRFFSLFFLDIIHHRLWKKKKEYVRWENRKEPKGTFA